MTEEVVEQVLADPGVQATDADKRREDWDVPAVPSARFVRLAHLAFVRGDIGIKRLAALLGTEVADVESKLLDYGLTTEVGLADAQLQTTAAM